MAHRLLSLGAWESLILCRSIVGIAKRVRWKYRAGDIARQFFVERTSLYDDGAGVTTVVLQHQLRNGLLVFIRELGTGSVEKEYPTVYRVELAEARDHTGFSKARLSLQSLHEVIYDATSERLEHLNQQWHAVKVKV